MTTSKPDHSVLAASVLAANDLESFATFQATYAANERRAQRYHQPFLDSIIEQARATFAADPTDANLNAYETATRRGRLEDLGQVQAVVEHANALYLRQTFTPWAISLVEKIASRIAPAIARFIAFERARAAEIAGHAGAAAGYEAVVSGFVPSLEKLLFRLKGGNGEWHMPQPVNPESFRSMLMAACELDLLAPPSAEEIAAVAAEEDAALAAEDAMRLAAAEQPAAEQPAAEQPAAEQPAAEQPAAEQPAAEQPAVFSPRPSTGMRRR